MEKTTKRKNSTSKKVEEQGAKTSGQETSKPVLNDVNDTNANRMTPENTDTAADKVDEQDTPIRPLNPQKTPNTFATVTANKIMGKIYELYGYIIKDNTCKTIISRAQQYAKAHNITINTNVNTINTHELYDHIVNLISNGYNLSPLDTTHNDIFLRAVVERYKM